MICSKRETTRKKSKLLMTPSRHIPLTKYFHLPMFLKFSPNKVNFNLFLIFAVSIWKIYILINVSMTAGSADEVEATLRKVYVACDRAQMLGRRRGVQAAQSAGVRGHLLRTLFLLVQREEQRVLLQLARLLLAVRTCDYILRRLLCSKSELS
jgi:hypothetical protein